MTHLLLVRGAVCTGTDVVANVVVLIGTVADEAVVITLLIILFVSASVLVVLWGYPPKEVFPSKVLKYDSIHHFF